MQGTDLILREEEHRKISRLADRLLREANAEFVALIDRNGQPISWSGGLEGLDKTALASLAAGNVAATEGLARMIGEQRFLSMYHEGDRDHLYMSAVGEIGILVVAFNERSSLGLVRLRVRQVTPDMEDVIQEVIEKSKRGIDAGDAFAPLGEITDDDIDNLFKDGF